MTEPSGVLKLDRSGSGWARYLPSEFVAAEVRLRCVRSTKGDAVEVRDVWVCAPKRVSARLLREIPVGRVEATLRSPNAWKRVAKLLPEAEDSAAPFPEGEWTGRQYISAPGDPVQTAVQWADWIMTGTTPKEDRLKVVYLLFTQLKAVSRSPATELSSVWNDTPTSTIHWWVKEARRLRLTDSSDDLRFSDGRPIDVGAGPDNGSGDER